MANRSLVSGKEAVLLAVVVLALFLASVWGARKIDGFPCLDDEVLTSSGHCVNPESYVDAVFEGRSQDG